MDEIEEGCNPKQIKKGRCVDRILWRGEKACVSWGDCSLREVYSLPSHQYMQVGFARGRVIGIPNFHNKTLVFNPVSRKKGV